METELNVKVRDILHSDSTQYKIMNFIGEGSFGRVTKCLNLTTEKIVAVKIPNQGVGQFLKWEIQMLQTIRSLDPAKANIVRFIESFMFQNVSCLVFEMLDRSLWDLMIRRRLDLNEIRPVTHQLLVALDALKGLGIIHRDLKPDNVMLVNHKDQPFKIKLIDFGMALPESKVQPGMIMQNLSYRAPEVTLGLPLSTAVDMWGVGCIMAHMYFGKCLFPDNCKYNWMKVMLHMLGQPDDCQLNSARNTWKYFTREHDCSNAGWRFKTPQEYREVTGINPQFSNRFLYCTASFKDLEDAVHKRQTNEGPLDLKDKIAFLRLLKGCLNVHSEERIIPREAMNHSFVTMAHLVDDNETSIYADTAFQLMAVSPLTHLDELYSYPDAEIATQDDRSEDSGADSPKPPIFFSTDEILDNSSSSSDSDSDTTSDDESSDEELSLSYLLRFFPKLNDGNVVKQESLHSAHRKPSPLHPSNEILAVINLHDEVSNTTTLSKEESGVAATINEGNTNNVCLSVDHNICDNKAPADIDPTDGAAPFPTSPDGVDIRTAPDEAKIATAPDGADILTDLDGAKIASAPGGANIITAPDEANVLTTPDAANIATVPDGANIITAPDEANVLTTPDEANVLTTPDAANIATVPDEANVLTTPDAANIATVPDGANIITAPDEANVLTTPDAANIATVPDGANIITAPDEDDIPTANDGAEITTAPDGVEISTVPDGPHQRSFFKRVRKFCGRVKKRVISMFICGKAESED